MAVGITRGKRVLGAAFQPLFKESGLSREALAKRADCSRQTIGRLLSGDGLVHRKALVSILHELGLERREIEYFKALHEVADASTGSISFPDKLSDKYRQLRLDEIEAKEELTLNPQYVPGALQTRRNATFLATRPGARVKEGWAEIAPIERDERRALLYREDAPLVLKSIIGEAALAALAGLDEEARVEQLDLLLDASTRPNITLQIVPFTYGPFGADHLTYLTFPSLREKLPENPDAVDYLLGLLGEENLGSAFADGLTTFEVYNNPKDLKFLHDEWCAVQKTALSEDDSRAVIKRWRDKAQEG